MDLQELPTNITLDSTTKKTAAIGTHYTYDRDAIYST